MPERFGDSAGEDATFRVIVKEVKHKVLPELTDEWVDEASEFDTVDELRDDIRKRLETVQKLQARMAARDKVLEAVADLVPIPAPEVLVDDETRRRVEDLAHRLSHQNATLEEYLQATGQEPQAFIDDVREGAGAGRARRSGAARGRRARGHRGQRRASSTPRSSASPSGMEQKVEKVRRDLERRGVLETVRSDLARGKALEFLIEHSTVVDEEGNVIDLTIPERQPSDATQTATKPQDESGDESTEDESTEERA